MVLYLQIQNGKRSLYFCGDKSGSVDGKKIRTRTCELNKTKQKRFVKSRRRSSRIYYFIATRVQDLIKTTYFQLITDEEALIEAAV